MTGDHSPLKDVVIEWCALLLQIILPIYEIFPFG